MKLYISGKITSLDIDVAEANFEEAERILTEQGHEVVNPMKLPHNHDKSWEAYMVECLQALLECEGIVMLPNWQTSKGARIEFNLAVELGLVVRYF